MISVRHGINLLLACALLSGCCVLCQAATRLRRSGNEIEITIDGRPFSTYYFDPAVAKPYLMPLRTASGSLITRPYPVRNDIAGGNPKDPSFEPHQRPLYFGHGDLDGLDFWGEEAFAKYYDDHARQAYGHVVLKALDVPGGPDSDVPEIRARFTLNSPHDRIIGEESQSFRFDGDRNIRVIDCEFVLSATAGPLDVGDTKEGTFAIRLGPELSAPFVHMVNSAGAEGEKAIWGKTADWVDYSGSIAGKRVDVVVFDSPRSFRHPTTWHARAYGLFAANPFGKREFTRDSNNDGSWTVPEGKSVRFRYRVLIHEGAFDSNQISEAYQKYAAMESSFR